jgi:type IV fimbrial biogenesis protein FimT
MRQRGFSIIEIAVTLVVLGMVLASAVPSMSAWVRNAKLRNQAESVLAGLQTARNEALRRNRPVTFYLVQQPTGSTLNNDCEVAADGRSWVVSVRSPDGACAAAPTLSSETATDPLIVTSRLGPDATVGLSVSAVGTDLATATSSVTFDALGRRSTGFARVAIAYGTARSDDRALRVDVGPSGNVRACDPAITSTDDPRRCL